MPRRLRCSDAGYAYHVLNRAVGRATLFRKSADYSAFEQILREGWEEFGLGVLSFVLMPNHWHLVVRPEQDGVLSRYLQWISVTHVRRWHAHHHTSGTGPIYQGRFKSFPIQCDDHFLAVCRYVERNALRAKRVAQAQDWRWSSLWHRQHDTQVPWLIDWPIAIPFGWTAHVNRAENERELMALRRSVARGAPYGDELWQQQTVVALGLESTLRPRGRPRKEESGKKET
jgi:putative transposase